MKELKNLIDKEDSEILDGELLEELCLIADANKAKRRRKVRAIATALATCLVAVFAVGFGILYHKGYTTTYETKESNTSCVNRNLIVTQVVGDFDTIELTYETRYEKPVYFSLCREEKGETRMQDISMKVIVARNYEIEEAAYLKEFAFLGYTVRYSETKNADHSCEPMVFDYKARALIDTGKERYMIDYAESNIEDNYHFTEYLQKTIKQK